MPQYIDPHIHMISRVTDDYQRMAYAGCQLVSEPAFWAGFMKTFGVAGEIVASRPSIVETTFRDAPGRTLFAHLAKAPAHLEGLVLGKWARERARFWQLVGGWEVLIRIR